MGRLPHFLSYGFPPTRARFARGWSSANNNNNNNDNANANDKDKDKDNKNNDNNKESTAIEGMLMKLI